jgi:hypothetical protein
LSSSLSTSLTFELSTSTNFLPSRLMVIHGDGPRLQTLLPRSAPRL